MRIEFFEGDESTQSDGKPRHIYLSIEGKKLILPTDKTILDLLEIGKGIISNLMILICLKKSHQNNK